MADLHCWNVYWNMRLRQKWRSFGDNSISTESDDSIQIEMPEKPNSFTDLELRSRRRSSNTHLCQLRKALRPVGLFLPRIIWIWFNDIPITVTIQLKSRTVVLSLVRIDASKNEIKRFSDELHLRREQKLISLDFPHWNCHKIGSNMHWW